MLLALFFVYCNRYFCKDFSSRNFNFRFKSFRSAKLLLANRGWRKAFDRVFGTEEGNRFATLQQNSKAATYMRPGEDNVARQH
jgi:hypothetical protein